MSLKENYNINKKAKVRATIKCPVCHKDFKKVQYSQAFCSSRCKDKYHNIIDGDRHLWHRKNENGEIDIEDIDDIDDFKDIEDFEDLDYNYINNVMTVGDLKKVLSKFKNNTQVMVGQRSKSDGSGAPVESRNFLLEVKAGKDVNSHNCLFL